MRIPESPMTQFVYSSIQEILFSGKNVVLEFPSNFGDLSLIMANEFVYKNKKTAIVFTNPESIVGLNDDYYLITEESIPLRLRVPIGIKTESGVKIKVHFPKGTRKSVKGSLVEYYEEALLSSDRSIIILASDAEYVDFNEGELLLGGFKKPMLAIFNNISFPSESKLMKVITWCRENGLQYLILTNHLSPNYYEKMGDGPVILPFHNGLLRELSAIDESIGSIFGKPNYRDNSAILSKFSIDQPYHYKSELSVDYVVIDNGSVLVQCAKEMSQILNSMNIKSMALKHDVIQLVNIGYECINSFIPIDAQTKYSEIVGVRINGMEFCKSMIDYSDNTDASLRNKIYNLTSTFMTIWNCLDRCKTPFYNRGYSKDNKFSILVEEIRANLDNYERIYVLPVNKQELNQLNKLLKLIFREDFSKISIMSIVNIDENRIRNAMALLPGNPKLNELYVLNYSFEKVKILTYHDDNDRFVRNLVSLYTHIDNYRNNIFSISISNIIREVPGIQKNISNMPSIEKYIKESHAEASSTIETDLVRQINREVVKKCPDLYDFLEEVGRFERVRKKYENESLDNYVQSIKRSSSYYVLKLENLYTGQTTTSYSALNTTHSFFVNSELQENPISESMEGAIIVKAPGSHSNLLETLLDLYGLKDKIDYEIVNIWNECVLSFEKNERSPSDMYKKYIEFGGTKQRQAVYTWFKRKVMGPNNKKDLEIIGKVLENEELITNADYIFKELERIRNYKRSLGRRLVRIITSIIQHEQSDDEDPFAEMIRENVKNYLFIIKQIERIDVK